MLEGDKATQIEKEAVERGVHRAEGCDGVIEQLANFAFRESLFGRARNLPLS